MYCHHCTLTTKRLAGSITQLPHLDGWDLFILIISLWSNRLLYFISCSNRLALFLTSWKSFTSVSAAMLYRCGNLWPSACMCVCVCLCVRLLCDRWWGLTWRYDLPQHWPAAKDEKTDKPIKQRWAAWLEEVLVFMRRVGWGVEGRLGYGTEWVIRVGWGGGGQGEWWQMEMLPEECVLGNIFCCWNHGCLLPHWDSCNNSIANISLSGNSTYWT